MGQSLLKIIQPNCDKVILRMLDPRSKCLSEEGKARLKEILESKGSGIWDRRKKRWREMREHAKEESNSQVRI
jgi:hypothetical protein